MCVPHLFVNLCKLVQVILKKGNLLLLGARPPAIIRFHFGTLQKRRRSKEMKKKAIRGTEGAAILSEVDLGVMS